MAGKYSMMTILNIMLEKFRVVTNYPINVIHNMSPANGIFIVNCVMIACFSVVVVFTCFVLQAILSVKSDTGWYYWALLGVVSVSEIIVCVVGLRGSYYVSLEILLSYFWGILVLIVPLCICLYGCINYYATVTVYSKKQWSHQSFNGLREFFCDPPDTANTLCAVPFDQNVTSYCLINYQSTNCEVIRDNAYTDILELLDTVCAI